MAEASYGARGQGDLQWEVDMSTSTLKESKQLSSQVIWHMLRHTALYGYSGNANARETNCHYPKFFLI